MVELRTLGTITVCKLGRAGTANLKKKKVALHTGKPECKERGLQEELVTSITHDQEVR